MIVLGIETATPHGGAALWQDGRILACAENDGAVSHSQRLMPDIERILRETGLTLEALDGFAVSIGPGSFTGLRIGLSVAKTLAHITKKPLAAVPTLEALAERFARPGVILAPMLDARRSEVFAALFRQNHPGEAPERLLPDVVATPEDLANRIAELFPPSAIEPELILAGGSGAERYADYFAERLAGRSEMVSGERGKASAAEVAMLGARQLQQGQAASVLTLEPVYVRKSDAELTAARRQSK